MLTPKQERFADAYIVEPNGRQAAIKAGYSPKGASVEANRLLKNVNVLAKIQAAQGAATSEATMTLQEATERLTRIARGDDDGLAIKSIERLSKLLGWEAPQRLALTDAQGHDKPTMSPDEVVSLYADAVSRAIADAPPIRAAVEVGPHRRPKPPAPEGEEPEPPRRSRLAIAS